MWNYISRLAFLETVKERRIAAKLATKELAEKDDGEQAIRDEVLKNVVNQFKGELYKPSWKVYIFYKIKFGFLCVWYRIYKKKTRIR